MQDYSINQNIKSNDSICSIWLVNKNGDILIKNINNKELLDISDVTLKADSLYNLVRSIEDKWGIMILSENLEEIHTFRNDLGYFTVYILKMTLNREAELLVEEKFNGIFVNFRDIDARFNYSRKTPEFLESFTALVAKLDEEFR